MNQDISNSYPTAEIIILCHTNHPVKEYVSFSDIVVNGRNWGLFYFRKPS